MEFYEFNIEGYQNYSEIEERLENILYSAFEYRNTSFLIAVNEAICNAAKYSIYGITSAPISIRIRVTGYDVAVTVSSETTPFDVISYRKNILALMKDPIIKDMDWGDYLKDRDASRGIWYMLTGSDYLYFDPLGQAVTLVTRTDAEHNMFDIATTKIGMLVPRFLISEGGVIT